MKIRSTNKGSPGHDEQDVAKHKILRDAYIENTALEVDKDNDIAEWYDIVTKSILLNGAVYSFRRKTTSSLDYLHHVVGFHDCRYSSPLYGMGSLFISTTITLTYLKAMIGLESVRNLYVRECILR